MKLFDLTGKVAIVTGGNGGIGLGMARGLAQAGASVMLAGRNVGKSSDAVKELQAAGAQAAMVKVDVLSEESCRDMVQKTVVSPVRQISGLMQGITAGLEFLFAGRGVRNGRGREDRRPVPQDEMFI